MVIQWIVALWTNVGFDLIGAGRRAFLIGWKKVLLQTGESSVVFSHQI